MSSPKKPYRVGVAGLAVIALITVPTLTYAFGARIIRDIQHFIDCAQWQWHDVEAWRANCQPGNPLPVIEPPIPNPDTASSVSSKLPDAPSSIPSSTPSSSSSSSEPELCEETEENESGLCPPVR